MGFLIAITAVLLLVLEIAATCYYPDGSRSNDQACDPQAGNSMCCAYGTDCLMNGVCHSMAEIDGDFVSTYARGSCTDRSWESYACINQCIYEGVYNQPGPLVPCSNNVNAFFCYYQERNNDGEHCEQRSDVFTLVGGNSIRTTIGVAVATSFRTVSQVSIATVKSLQTETVFVTPTPTPTPTPTSTPEPSSDTPYNGPSDYVGYRGRTTSSSSSSSTETAAAQPSSSTSKTAVIGGAVGGSVGAICLALFGYLAYVFGKRRAYKTDAQPMEQVAPGPENSYYGQYGQYNQYGQYGQYGQHPAHMPVPSMIPHPQFALAPVPPAAPQSPIMTVPPPPGGPPPPDYEPYSTQFFGPVIPRG